MRHFGTRPPEPLQLMALLHELFPQFGNDDEIQKVQSCEHSLHYVMSSFTYYFGDRRGELSERQFLALGHLLDEAVAVDDALENAVSTCFLEHLRQIDSYKLLAPYLSERTKERTHA
jgi:hypothetical protein